MRDINRKVANATDRRRALELIDAMKVGRLVGCMADRVEHEFYENVAAVLAETEQGLARLRKQLVIANEIVGLFGPPSQVPLDHFDGHAVRTRGVAETLMRLATRVSASHDVAGRAVARVRANAAPSTKGKQSIKDCVVIETYFDHVRQLREAGDDAKVVFLSSNREDYCEEGSLTLRAPLKAEFIALGMEFWPNFGAAKHALGL